MLYVGDKVCLIFAHWRASFVPEIRYWSVISVNHDVDLSSIQWRTSSHQCRPPVGIALSSCSSMQWFQGEGRGIRDTVGKHAAMCQYEPFRHGELGRVISDDSQGGKNEVLLIVIP